MKAAATRFEDVLVWWKKARHFVLAAYSLAILDADS
jgi:hypothetical protein